MPPAVAAITSSFARDRLTETCAPDNSSVDSVGWARSAAIAPEDKSMESTGWPHSPQNLSSAATAAWQCEQRLGLSMRVAL